MPRPLHSGGWRALLNKRGDVYVPITSPLDIPGVGAYWSGAEANAEGYTPGQVLVQLNDYSGNSNPWTQANVARRGTWRANAFNGQGAVRLDNIDDGYTGTYDPGAPPKAGTMAVLYAPNTALSSISKHLVGTYGANPFLFIQYEFGGTYHDGPRLVGASASDPICNTGVNNAADLLVPVGLVAAYTETDVDYWVNGFHNPTYAVTHTPRVVSIGYPINGTNPAAADIIEVIVWTRTLESDEIEDLFIYWHMVFGLNESYLEDFSNPRGRTIFNGYRVPVGNFHKLADHDWSESPWVVRDHYLKSYTDDAESHTVGSNLNGLLATWGTSIAATGTVTDINNRIFGGVSDNRFRLRAGYLSWPMPWGDDWSRVKLSIALTCTDAGSAPPGFFSWFDFGVRQGLSYAAISHAVGMLTYESSAWGYSAGNYYLNRVRVGKVVDGVRSYGAATANHWLAITPDSKMCGTAVEITRGDPNFNVRNVPPFSGNPGPSGLILEEMEGNRAISSVGFNPVRYSNTGTDWLNENLAVDEATDGVLDSFFIFWGSSHFDMEIAAIKIDRLL